MLIGPRQVGKTVLLRQIADDLLDAGWPSEAIVYFDFSDERLAEAPQAHLVVDALPTRRPTRYPTVLLFDEIGYAPLWNRWLKRIVDEEGGPEDRRFRIAVADSAASRLREGSRESGLGRWDELRIETLAFDEFVRLSTGQDAPSVAQAMAHVDRYLLIGGFPEHARSAQEASVTLALERLRHEIVDRAVLRDLAETGVDTRQLRRLFVYLMETSGAELKASRYATRAKVDVRSVHRWLNLLEETLLVVPLELAAASAGKRARAQPKIYAADPGLVSAFSYQPQTDPGARGRQFESAVFRHLRSLDRVDLAFVRNRRKQEIEFLLTSRGRRTAVEVTSNRSVRHDKLARLEAAAMAVEADRRVLVHGGIERGERSGTVLRPIPDVLLRPAVVFEDEA